jgi:hypothetical protein
LNHVSAPAGKAHPALALQSMRGQYAAMRGQCAVRVDGFDSKGFFEPLDSFRVRAGFVSFRPDFRSFAVSQGRRFRVAREFNQILSERVRQR